jgi:hypothetical protein
LGNTEPAWEDIAEKALAHRAGDKAYHKNAEDKNQNDDGYRQGTTETATFSLSH